MTPPADPFPSPQEVREPPDGWGWEFCRSCAGAGWVGARVDHKHPGCGHRCILCDPPPGYDRTYALSATPGGPT